jgi:hypothetical protein
VNETIFQIDDSIFPWPTDEGMWMGWVDHMTIWFPMRAKYLLGDDPSNVDTYQKPIALVAQFPESETSWPFLFKGSHPVNQWRRPTEAELEKAKTFYASGIV